MISTTRYVMWYFCATVQADSDTSASSLALRVAVGFGVNCVSCARHAARRWPGVRLVKYEATKCVQKTLEPDALY